MDKKRCSKCKQEKPLSEFYKRKYSTGNCGVRSSCKQCCKIRYKKWRSVNKLKITEYYKNKYQGDYKEKQKEYSRNRRNAPGGKEKTKDSQLKTRYNLTLDEHLEMYIFQNGKCVICKQRIEYSKINTDHNHRTGKVRGLLCHLCNIGLGAFRDNSQILANAIEYLRETL